MPNGDEWLDSDEPPEEVYLCLLDVLGFKGMVHGNPLRQVARTLRDARAKTPATVPEDVRDEHAPDSLMYSDSVLFWVEGSSADHLGGLVRTVNSFFATSFQDGLLLRGGLVQGELSIAAEGEVIVGEGLVRAYELEQGQKWGGIVVDPRLVDASPAGLSDLKGEGILVEEDVPWATNPSPRPHTVVCWPTATDVTEDELRTQFDDWFDEAPEDGRAKLEATLRFFDKYSDPPS